MLIILAKYTIGMYETAKIANDSESRTRRGLSSISRRSRNPFQLKETNQEHPILVSMEDTLSLRAVVASLTIRKTRKKISLRFGDVLKFTKPKSYRFMAFRLFNSACKLVILQSKVAAMDQPEVDFPPQTYRSRFLTNLV